jgi:hypothetical protein
MDEVLYGMRAARATVGSPGASGISGGSTAPPYGPGAHASAYDATAPAAHRFAPSTVARTDLTPAPIAAMSNPPMAGMAGMAGMSNPPPAIPAAARFPWVIVVAVLASLLVVTGGGLAIALLASSGGPALSLPSLPGPAGALGPRTAFIEPLDLKFAGTSATDVAKSKSALEAKLTSCFDAHVSKDLSFSTRIFVAADGRITKADDLQVCKEQHPGFYLCTERVNAAKPKSGFPTVPESVFACLERALVSSRLPRVIADPGETTTHSDIHVQVR